MKKIICILMIVLLCGCSENVQSSNKYNMEKADDFFTVIMEEFGKEIGICSSFDTLEVYADRENDIIEYRVDYSSQNSYYVYRAKKADSFEDITEDMSISWENKADSVDGVLSGFKGNGTVTLEYFGLENHPFDGEVWFDSTDNMVYAAIIIGYSDELTSVKTVCKPGYFTPLDFETYEEAQQFIANYRDEFFYRSEENGSSSVYREDDFISVFTGNDENYISKHFYPDGIVQMWTKTTDPETGNYVETIEDTGMENWYSEAHWTKDLQCTYSYGKSKVTSDSNETKYDLNGKVIYERHEDEDKIEETTYEGMYGTHTTYYKKEQYENNITFKVKNADGHNRRYYLTIDNKYHTKEYTYLSEDSLIYTKHEVWDKTDGEHVIWYFDGKGNDTDHVVKLERTINGVTTTYAHTDIPWGTGMHYPPKNPHDFYF